MYDWLIVGAGLYGATFARTLTDAGYRCLIIEKRNVPGGNCADRLLDGVRIQEHGGHVFHTNNWGVWQFVNRFADFWPYRHRVKANYNGNIYSFPFNLMTLAQIYGITTPAAAADFMNGLPAPNGTLESWAISQIGYVAYNMLVKGYTEKQWGKPASELPMSIIKRIPVRMTYNDDYFDDTYQGLPVDGFSAMISSMLDGIEVRYGVDYLGIGPSDLAAHTLYTGPLDALFDYDLGTLAYRGLRWEWNRHESDYQGAATINYTAADVPYTRIIEYRHFMQNPPAHSITATEYPTEWQPGDEPYYPVNDAMNNALACVYKARAREMGIHTGGRLADYKYYDMHQAIGAAMVKAERWIDNDN
jgi:UDP-galactopyranose mutase